MLECKEFWSIYPLHSREYILSSKGRCYDVINPTIQALSIPLEFVGIKHTFMFHVHINPKHIVQYISMHVYLYSIQQTENNTIKKETKRTIWVLSQLTN